MCKEGAHALIRLHCRLDEAAAAASLLVWARQQHDKAHEPVSSGKKTGSSILYVLTPLLGVQSLLGEPNNDSPLNTHAAKLWANADEYRRVLHKKYAEAAAK